MFNRFKTLWSNSRFIRAIQPLTHEERSAQRFEEYVRRRVREGKMNDTIYFSAPETLKALDFNSDSG